MAMMVQQIIPTAISRKRNPPRNNPMAADNKERIIADKGFISSYLLGHRLQGNITMKILSCLLLKEKIYKILIIP